MENMQIAVPEFPVRGKIGPSGLSAANDNAAFIGAFALTIPGESIVVDDAAVSDSILRAKAMSRHAALSAHKSARWQRVANALIAGVREKFSMERKD